MRFRRPYQSGAFTGTRIKGRGSQRSLRAIGVVLLGLLSSVMGWVGGGHAAKAHEVALQQPKTADQDPTIDQRIQRIRAEAQRDLRAHGGDRKNLRRLAQWYNWGDWPNFWSDWGNWPNYWGNY